MKKKLLALLMGTSLVLAACGGGDEAGEEKDTATGGGGETTTANPDAEKLFSQSCVQCHGEDLSGGVGPNLQKVGASLSKEDIEKIIVEGKGAMPAGQLKGDDAATVAEWLANKK